MDKRIWGVSWWISTWKSFLCNKFCEIWKQNGITVKRVEVDEIRRNLLSFADGPESSEVRTQLVDCFGVEIVNANNSIDRIKLLNLIYSTPEHLEKYKSIVTPYIRKHLIDATSQPDDLVLIERSMLLEDWLLDVVNGKVILVWCDEQIQKERLHDSDMWPEQVQKRIAIGGSFDHKYSLLKNSLMQRWTWRVILFDTSNNPWVDEYRKLLLEEIVNYDHR